MATLPDNPPAKNSKKANYGIDAPGVIRNMFIGAMLCFLVAVMVTFVKISFINVPAISFISPGLSFLLSGSLMLLYSLYGKYKYREHLLDAVNWKGNEQVLDVGTGKGLLIITQLMHYKMHF